MLLGIDIGGTAVKLGLVSETGEVLVRDEASVSYDRYETPILTSTIRAARTFLQWEGVVVDGIGVSATGQVDDDTGVIIGTDGKIPRYEGTRIREEIEAAFGVPARVLNDANAAVLGENWVGAAKGYGNVVMLTLGTGVGGGIIVDGRLLRGARGIAGEIGHFTLDRNGVLCGCGRRGCLESYASTTALVDLAQAATGESGLNGRTIFERVRLGDPQMKAVHARWLDDIAAGVIGLAHIFNPEIVLVGGGVSVQEELLMQPLRERVLRGAMPRFAEGLKVERAALGNDAGLIGAVRFYLDMAKAN